VGITAQHIIYGGKSREILKNLTGLKGGSSCYSRKGRTKFVVDDKFWHLQRILDAIEGKL